MMTFFVSGPKKTACRPLAEIEADLAQFKASDEAAKRLANDLRVMINRERILRIYLNRVLTSYRVQPFEPRRDGSPGKAAAHEVATRVLNFLDPPKEDPT